MSLFRDSAVILAVPSTGLPQSKCREAGAHPPLKGLGAGPDGSSQPAAITQVMPSIVHQKFASKKGKYISDLILMHIS